MTTLLYAQIAQLLVEDGFELTSLIFATSNEIDIYEAIYRKDNQKVVLSTGMELTKTQKEMVKDWQIEWAKPQEQE